ncbi:MAG: hypothetical protein IJQ32_04685 [Paludibacteraceae bacterium]|nr:hypothetical protein [Paludibacteraceae bacterium]
MKKVLLFALAAMTLAFVACDKKDKKKSEPEPEGKVYHYDATLTLNDMAATQYSFQLYFTVNDNNEVAMRWENVKYEGKTFDLYYTGKCKKLEDEVYEMQVEDKFNLKDGTPFDGFGIVRASFEFGDKVTWFSRDAHLIYDNGENIMAWIDGKIVKDEDPEDKDAKVLNATGELRGVMFDVYNENQQAVVTYHPNKNTIDVKFVKAQIVSTSESPKDIYIYNMKVNAGETHINLVLEDGSPYASFPKSYAYAILDPNLTTLNMHFGNDSESDTQVYFVYNATLK